MPLVLLYIHFVSNYSSLFMSPEWYDLALFCRQSDLEDVFVFSIIILDILQDLVCLSAQPTGQLLMLVKQTVKGFQVVIPTGKSWCDATLSSLLLLIPQEAHSTFDNYTKTHSYF